MVDQEFDPLWGFLDLVETDDEDRLQGTALLIGGIAWQVPRAFIGDEVEREESALPAKT